MLKNSNTVIPYKDIDYELRPLIWLINNELGIETVECCSGHGEEPCRIWCVAGNAEIFQKFMHKYFYCDVFWEAKFDMSDVSIDNEEWDTLHFVLQTSSFINNEAVIVAISELTKRIYLEQNDIDIREQFNIREELHL